MGDNEYKDYTAVLRIASGQETETDFVLIEHAYSKPFNWNPGLSHARLRKTLFINRIVRDPGPLDHNEDIDVVTLGNASAPLPYDIDKAKHVMNECERHVRGISQSEENMSDDDEAETEIWEEKVDRTSWSATQQEIFQTVVEILDSHHLARLALSGTANEPVKRRAIVDKASAKFRRLFAKIRWEYKLTQWLHGCLLQNLTPSYLAAYIDVLQMLKSQIPTLVDKMIALTVQPKTPRVDALNLLLRRPWDPALPSLNQSKPKKLEKMPIIIIVPNGASSPHLPQASRRTRFFNTQLQHLAKSIPINVSATHELSDAKSILDSIIHEVKTKIAECKRQFVGQPIVLLGWGIGAILAAMVSLNEKVDALVLLGFPMQSHAGRRGEADDILLDVKTPTLFIIGSKALNTSVDDVEDFRHRLKTITSLVVISDAEATLKISHKKQYWQGLTQSMVDRCIVDEVGEFLTSVLCDEAQNPLPVLPSPATTFTTDSPIPTVIHRPKATREGIKKRKMSPMSLETSFQMPSKVFRAGTNISQQLGLKIPLGNSGNSTQLSSEVGTGSTVKTHINDSHIDSEAASSSKKIDGGSSFLGNLLSNQPSKGNSWSPHNTPKDTLASSVTTISIGGLASVSKQRYQSLFQANEDTYEDTDGDRTEFARPPQTAALPITLNKRGRPPNKSKGRGLSNSKAVKHYGRGRPPSSGRSSVGRGAEKTKVSLATDEDTSMAVLTFTGGAADSEGQDKIEGLSTVGRGFLTLGRGGGTSSVRVFSTNSGKISSQKVIATGDSPFIKISSGTSADVSEGSRHVNESIQVSSISNLICIEKGEVKKINAKIQPKTLSSLASLPQSSVGQMSVNLQGMSAARIVPISRALMPKIAISGKSTVMLVTSSTSTIPLFSTGIATKAAIKPVVVKNKDTQDITLNEPKPDSTKVSAVDPVTTVDSVPEESPLFLNEEKNKEMLQLSGKNSSFQLGKLKAGTLARKGNSLCIVTSMCGNASVKPENKPILVSRPNYPSFISSPNQKISFTKVLKSTGVQMVSPGMYSQPIKLSTKCLTSGGVIIKSPLKINSQENLLSTAVTSANPVITDVISVNQPITQSGIVTKKVVISKKVVKELTCTVPEDKISLLSISTCADSPTSSVQPSKRSPAAELNLVHRQTADAMCTTIDTEDLDSSKSSFQPSKTALSIVDSSAKRRLSEIKVSITTPTKTAMPIELPKGLDAMNTSSVLVETAEEASDSVKSPKQTKELKKYSESRVTRSTAKNSGSTRRGRPFRSNT